LWISKRRINVPQDESKIVRNLTGRDDVGPG
jgi:hypothetical protein